jgi:transketolase
MIVTIAHNDLANAIRFLSIDAVEKAKSGHPGMPMGMADVATVLWRDFLRFDAENPRWPDRDRFILSAGHGSMLLYSLLYLTGHPDMPLDQLQQFRQLDSHTAGHPEYGFAQGIETTTGPLGQGLANAVGMALAEAMLQADFGSSIVNHKTYVLASDGDLMEGISQEAISLAGHWKLKNLIVLYDDNAISIDGPTSLAFSDDTLKRFEACGWNSCRIDGHNPTEIHQALLAAQTADRPTLIACKTTIAYGAPTKAGTSASHGAPLGETEIQGTREYFGWSHAPFVIPDKILTAWRAIGQKGKADHHQWQHRFAAFPQSSQEEFHRRMAKKLPQNSIKALSHLRSDFAEQQLKQATRQLSQQVLDIIAPHLPELVGGSADLTGSNNTKAKAFSPMHAPDYQGRYIYYGVREHAMAAIINGISLHGGFRPYGGTFLIFSDYLRPSLRLAALMHQPVIHVLTHDSIGLGEDGPTHQPIEHLAALRAIPNLNVFRPADAVEVAECWQLALESTETPSVLALTRQNIIPVRKAPSQENLSAQGGYIVREASRERHVTLLATGSEVGLAAEIQEQLEQIGIPTALVSLPCWRLFEQQSESYRAQVLGKAGIKVAIEAASSFGWDRYVGANGMICALDHFGASAPYQKLYEKFGLTVEQIINKIKRHLIQLGQAA